MRLTGETPGSCVAAVYSCEWQKVDSVRPAIFLESLHSIDGESELIVQMSSLGATTEPG